MHEYFDIIGGLRWDYFSANQDNKRPGQTDFDSTDKMLSYRGGLVFYPTSQQSYYFEGVTYSLQGKAPQNVPEYTATFWTTYDFLDKWQIGGGPTYVGSRYANNSNSRKVPGYVRWDATVAYNISEKIQFRLNAANFTNKHYIESVHPSHVVPGAGMTFIASTAFRF